MNADRCPAPVKLFPQLKTSFRGGGHVRWRDETRVHLTLLNAEGLCAALLPDFSDRTRNSGLSCAAATSWPLIFPGDVSFRSTRPTLPPPLDRQATLSPALSPFPIPSSGWCWLLNLLEAAKV